MAVRGIDHAGQDADPDAAEDAGVFQRTERGHAGEQFLALGQQVVGAGGQRRGGRGHLADRLRADLLSGALKPGEQLVQETLAERYGVSRVPLRDAAGRSQYLAGLRAADITRLTGRAAGRAATIQAGATLFSGATSGAQMGIQYRRS